MDNWYVLPIQQRVRTEGSPCLNAEGLCAAGLYCNPQKKCQRLPFYQPCSVSPANWPRDPRNHVHYRGDNPIYFANVAKQFTQY